MNSRTAILAAATVIAGLGCLFLLTATPAEAQGPGQKSVDVNVVNTPNVRVLTLPEVRVLNEKEPYVRQEFLPIPDGTGGAGTGGYIVPIGKVLVLESISVESNCLDLTYLQIVGDGQQRLLVRAPDVDLSGTIIRDSRLIAVRFAAGTDVRLGIGRAGSSGNSGAIVTVNGYLEPAPPSTD